MSTTKVRPFALSSSPVPFPMAKGVLGAAVFSALVLALTGCGGKSFSQGDQPLVGECDEEQDEDCAVGGDGGVTDTDTDTEGPSDTDGPSRPASCMNDGQEIAHGDSIRVSCNTCSCTDGLLECTLIGCDPGPSPGPDPDPTPAPPGSCTTPDGQVFADGESFQLDCNTCGCLEGELLCTAIACATGCTVDGAEYEHGAMVPSEDECCVCEFGGVSCTAGACDPPEETCEFGGVTYQSGESFTNGCNGCVCDAGLIACDARVCPPEDGSCTVRGKTYPNGSSLPDPYSCNTCGCEDGEITVCTEAYCPILQVKPCAPGAERVDFPHDSASISDGYLNLGVTHSGGCAEHVFELCHDPFVSSTSTNARLLAPGEDPPGMVPAPLPPRILPPSTTLHLTHVDPGDPCDGIVQATLVFDLYPFTEAGYDSVELTLGQDQLTYTSP